MSAALATRGQRLGNRADPCSTGVGLGLAIVRAIANAHDATVSAQARTSGGGLRIEVGFPRKGYRL